MRTRGQAPCRGIRADRSRRSRPAERFRYVYKEDELEEWVPRVCQVAEKAKETHLLFNNCCANYGTTNARQLAQLLL
jgi:uncharacterized protein YecE (DUF72 family)